MSTAAVQTETYSSRKPGRPSTSAPFAGLAREMLARDPSSAGSTLLEAARQQGYDGGHSAFYAMVAAMRERGGVPSASASRATAMEVARAERAEQRATRVAAMAQKKADREAAKARGKADRQARAARWAAETEERRRRKARRLEEDLAVGRDEDPAITAPVLSTPESPLTVQTALGVATAPTDNPTIAHAPSGADTPPPTELEALRAQLAALTRVIERLTAGPAQKQTTIGQLFDAYQRIRQADTSWKNLRNRLRPLVRRLGRLRVFELTPTVWAEHVAVRKMQQTMRNRPPTDQTLNIELQRAKEMIDWGVTAGLVDTNALKPARKIKTISARETFLTEPQIMELLDLGVAKLPSIRAQLVMRAFVLCAYDGMMRLQEVRRLRRDRIGKDGVIELQAKQTKSRKRRMVALTPRALAALAEIPPVEGTQQVFTNPETGKLHGVTTIESWFRAACIASGVDTYAVEGERVLIHTLRHSGASAADARGASPSAVKDALGHSSLATTERYLHRHREASARDLARLMAEGAAREAGAA
jgi:integrase